MQKAQTGWQKAQALPVPRTRSGLDLIRRGTSCDCANNRYPSLINHHKAVIPFDLIRKRLLLHELDVPSGNPSSLYSLSFAGINISAAGLSALQLSLKPGSAHRDPHSLILCHDRYEHLKGMQEHLALSLIVVSGAFSRIPFDQPPCLLSSLQVSHQS